MRHILCLLMLAPLHGACHNSNHQPKAPETREVTKTKPVRKELPRLDLEAFATPPPMLEMSIRDGEDEDMPKARYTCIATGEFNLSPALDHLLMETWCVGDTGDGGKIVIHVDDQQAPRANSHFEIPFGGEARVVIGTGSELTLELRYKDNAGNPKALPLPKRGETRYEFSFADLVPDYIAPLGEHRVM